MVADSKTQINKFLYGLLDLVKTEYMNVMLSGIWISSIMTHAQHVEGDKIKEQDMESKKQEHSTLSIPNSNRVVEMAHSFSRDIQL